ncbi:MAG: DUF5615 family PIN-like protein [Thermoleophilia bacterium]
MRLKADENLAVEAVRLLRSSGFDVATVREEGLAGATDERVAEAAADEERILLTLDLGFGNLADARAIRQGVVIFRLRHQSMDSQLRTATRLAALLSDRDPAGEMWVLREDRLRIRRNDVE